MEKKYINFLIIPEGSPKTYKFVLSSLKAQIILGVIAFLVFFVLVMSLLHGKLLIEVIAGKSLKQENERLKEYNARVVDLEKELNQYKAFVNRVAELAGVQYGHRSEAQLTQYDTEMESVEVDGAPPIIGTEEQLAQAFDSSSIQPDSLKNIPTGSPIKGWITQGFSMLASRSSNAHPGLDFAAKTGTEVKSTADGTIILAEWDETYGNLVAVDHGNGYVTYYGHNSKNLVNLGDTVSFGQVIALSGNTGRSSAPHLHYEIRRDDVPVNPESFINRK